MPMTGIRLFQVSVSLDHLSLSLSLSLNTHTSARFNINDMKQSPAITLFSKFVMIQPLPISFFVDSRSVTPGDYRLTFRSLSFCKVCPIFTIICYKF